MAVHPGTADMLGTVADTSAASAGEDMAKKVRKPYTITKSRESWTEQEHDKFLEALQLFDRDWKKIEAFVGSKTVIQIRSHAQKYFLKVQKNGTGEHVPPPRPKRKSAQPYPQKAAKSALAVQQVPTCVSQAEPAYTVVIEPCATTPVSSASAIPAWVHHMAPPGSVGFVKKDIATTGVGPMGGVPPKGQICSNGESSPVIQHQLVPMSQGNGDIVLRGGMESTSHREGAWKEWPPDISQLWQNRLNPESPYLAQELAESDDMHERIFSSAIQLDTHEPQMYSISLEMTIMEKTLCDFDQNSGLLSVDNCVCMLQKCREERDLHHAKHVHAQICSNGLEAHGAIGNYIVPMFVECGSLLNAQQVFNLLPSANEISWTSLILGYVNYGQAHYALNLYQKMQQDSVHPRSYTLVALLKACASLKDLEGGRKMHAEAAVNGFEGDNFVGNSLISLYVKCGSLSQAHRVFNKLPVRDVVSWTSLMDGYAEHGPRQEALKCFEQMQLEGISPSIFTFACSLKACSNLGAIDKGREIHMEATRKGFHQHLHVGNTLVGMYAKCSSPFEAHQVFNKLLVRDVVSWTAVIAGYAEHGPWQEALELYELMQLEGVFPNVVTFACTLKACGSTGSTDKGREIHTEITFKGFESDFSVGNSLVGMYAKCFAFPEAHQVFNKLSVRDAVSWTALIAGYAEHGFGHEALKCFEDMQLEGIPADAFTFACSLKACSCIGALDRGREIHLDILEKGLAKDVPIGNTLIDMYAKCGSLSEAQDVFDKLPLKTVVSWTSLIIGYAEHGPWQEVLRCFEQMQFEGISPNAVTFACVLRACGSIGAIDMGRAIHMEIAPNGLDRNPSVSNGLISMYAKCGLLAEARDVFDKLPVRDVAAWSVMIKGYGVNHEGGMAVKCFEEMLGQGVKPDAVTFTCLLTACSHGSLVRKGQEFFKMMIEDYGIVPVLEHHVCMVGLLARSGHLYEAEMFLGMLCSPSQRTWAALLSACKTYGEKELGMRCFRQLVQINPHVAAWYVLMADIYAGASMWDDAYRLEELRKHTGAIKKPASALIEVNRQVHEFVVGSKQSEEISEMLSTMSLHTKREGHMPNVDSVLKPITDKTKEGVLCEHAEKLAIAFGLLHTPQGETLRVTKSMRMCNDCHDASKIISKIEKREIILRDDCSIHHFKDGSCSCGDMF